MRLRLLLGSFLCILIAVSANAQQKKKSSLILKAGVNFSTISSTAGGRFEKVKSIMASHFGIARDLSICKYFSVQPGLFFTQKGAKGYVGTEPNNYKVTFNPSYIEVPVNFILHSACKKKFNVFAGGGPYIAKGLGGKNIIEGHGTNFYYSENSIEYTDENVSTLDAQNSLGFRYMRGLDVGFNGVAGFTYGKFLFSANYGYGLTKLQNTSEKNKNRVVGLSVGIVL